MSSLPQANLEVADSNTYLFSNVRAGDLVVSLTGSNAGFHAGYTGPTASTVISATPSNITLGTGSNQATLSNNALIIGGGTGAAGQICAGNLGMFRNRIINGDMRIDQRNAGAVSSNWGCDRFKIVGSNQYAITGQQVQLSNADIAATGFTNATKLTVTTGITSNIASLISFDDSNISDAYRGASNITTAGTIQYASGIVNRNQTALYLANEANVTAGTAAANYVTTTFSFPNDFTVSMWLNFTQFKTGTAQVAFCTSTTTSPSVGSLIIYNANSGGSNTLHASAYGVARTEGLTLSSNAWVHACVTRSGNNVTLYCNGYSFGSYSTTFSQSGGFLLGNSGTTMIQAFSGYIDDFRIYNRVLTTNEIAVLASFPSTNITDQLARYYPFDNSIADNSSNNSALTQTGSVSYVSGPVNQSLYLANEANVTASSTVPTNYLIGSYTQSTPVTFSFWMYMTKLPQASGQACYPLGFYNSAVSSLSVGVDYVNATTGRVFATYNSVGTTSTQNVSANTWYHIVGVYVPSSHFALYLNNSFVGVFSSNVPASFSSGPAGNGNGQIVIGNRFASGTYPFAGYIDDLRIYNRVLIQSEIAYLYSANQVYPVIPPMNQAIYMPFDGSLTDISGNNVATTTAGTIQYVNGITGSRALYLANESNVTAGTAAANYVTSTYTFPTNWTISAWLYFTQSRANTAAVAFATNTTTGSPAGSLQLYMYNGRITLEFASYAAPYNVVTTTNTWIHACGSITGSNVTFYYNGGLIGSYTGAFTQSGFILGNSGTATGQAFSGYIDDFRIYKTAFTAQEVAALYYGSAQLFSPITQSISGHPSAAILYQQSIEGNNISDLLYGTSAAQPVTLSCWIKNNTSNAQQFTLALNNGLITSYAPTTSNSRGLVAITSPITSNSWQRVSVTVPGDVLGTWDSSSNLGLNFALVLGSSSNTATSNVWTSNTVFSTSNVQVYGNPVSFLNGIGNNILVTGVQLEKGNVATPFEFRPYGTELQLCQRYCVVRGNPVEMINYAIIGVGVADNTSRCIIPYQLPVEMCKIPTMSVTGTWTILGTTKTASDFFFNDAGIITKKVVAIGLLGTYTANTAGLLSISGNASNTSITFNAEL